MRHVALLIVTSAAYGFSLGVAHSTVYATRNLIKFPLLLLTTALVCAVAYFVTALFLAGTSRGLGKLFAGVQRLVIGQFRDLSILLASLAPVNGFLAYLLRTEDDRLLGEYPMFLGVNVGFVAVAGGLSLIRQGRELLGMLGVGRVKALGTLATWVTLSMLVGGQGAFVLRPFFGLPVTRGQTPPFALWSEPDVRGARNFFEAVEQVFTNPPLPRAWNPRVAPEPTGPHR